MFIGELYYLERKVNMGYEKGNLKINTDFEVKEIQKDECNVDLLILVENRCLNLYLDSLPDYINSRIQFTSVKSILIRFCILQDNNICTIHLLSDDGIYSTMTNFEINYSKTYIEVVSKEFSVDMRIIEKK